jgi:hypothetical protein
MSVLNNDFFFVYFDAVYFATSAFYELKHSVTYTLFIYSFSSRNRYSTQDTEM